MEKKTRKKTHTVEVFLLESPAAAKNKIEEHVMRQNTRGKYFHNEHGLLTNINKILKR